MNKLKREAVILSLIKQMRKHDNWCGETHVQKACYILEELFNNPLEFDFILYKHGPYSFDLSDELSDMQADSIVELYTKQPPYGPSFRPSANSKQLENMYPTTLTEFKPIVEFVAEKVGSARVSDLEKLSTALYVTCRKDDTGDIETRSTLINRLKPHVSIDEAREATKNIDQIIEDAKKVYYSIT